MCLFWICEKLEHISFHKIKLSSYESSAEVGTKMKMEFSISKFLIIFLNISSHRIADAVSSKFNLPTSIQPIKYTLELLIDVQHEWPNYEERVSIKIRCMEEKTDEIFLNVKRSDIIINEENVQVKLFESKQEYFIGVKNHVHDVENDIHIIQLSELLEVNEVYEVLIPFRKSGSHRAKGYYVDEHKDASKNGQEFIAMQLGPSDARGIFPCMDQIQLKARFKVFLKHYENFWSFGNMKGFLTKKLPDMPNFVEAEFIESPPMTTSNIAFVLINYKMFKLWGSSENESNLSFTFNGPIRFYAAETIIDNMQFAYGISRLILNFYSEFFESKYALPSLNIIALPDFQDKDKAKYGIITLPDAEMSYPGNEEVDIALSLCHSMSHQWLGTRVTMSSWNTYWLHEAFAYFLETPCLESIFIEGKLTFQKTSFVKIITFLLPYEVEASSYTLQDFDYFDNVDSYGLGDAIIAKGFCLVRMLNFSFGDKLIQKSLASYMKIPENIGSSLAYVGNIFTSVVNNSKKFSYYIDVNEFMNGWISKKGLPLLTVTRSKNGKSVDVVQKNFRSFYDHDETVTDNSCWMMPLRFTTEKDTTPDKNQVHHWIDCAKPFSIDINSDKDNWMILDLRWNVLCRINYDDDNWNAIRLSLMIPEYSKIHALSRVQLISDLFAFLDTGILSHERVFEILKFLVHENSLLPMTIAVNELLTLRERLLGSIELFYLFQEYVRKIFEVKFEKQSAGGDASSSQTNHENFSFERLIVKAACTFGVQKCQQFGKTVFDQWLNTDEEQEKGADDREAYYCQAMKSATIMQWEFLWQKYDVRGEAKFNNDILMALGCPSDEGILDYYLHLSYDPSMEMTADYQILPEDSLIVFESVAMNEKGYPPLKRFITEHFQDIKMFLNGSSVSIDLYLKKLLDITTKTEDLNDLLTVMENNNVNYKDFEANVRKAKRNIWWLEEYAEKLKLYFQKQMSSF